MSDPFADNSNNRLQREVQVWMAGLACLLIAFLYLAVKRLAGPNDEMPVHIGRDVIAHATAPNDLDPKSPQLMDVPKLTSVPPIPAAGFSIPTVTSLDSKRRSQPSFDYLNRRKMPETFIAEPESATAKLDNVRKPIRDNQFAFPKPKFVAAPNLESTAADIDAEALGRQRAKQLAAITSGLPKRLNTIQSSIKQASADLPMEDEATKDNTQLKDNGLVPIKLFPAQPIPVNPIVVKPKAEQPIVESSHPIKSLNTKTSPIKPIRQPKSQPDAQLHVRPTAIGSPAKIETAESLPDSNSFQPLPRATASETVSVPRSVEPLPAARKLELQTTKLPKALRPAALQANDAMNLSKPVDTMPRHVVKKGESFFTIAQQHYGDGQWFRALRSANLALVDVTGGLQPGMSLAIPTTEQLARQFPSQAFSAADDQPSKAQQRLYITQEGDTLFDIARRKIGQGSRFSEIINANQFSLPARVRASDKLPADIRLVLPESTLQ